MQLRQLQRINLWIAGLAWIIGAHAPTSQAADPGSTRFEKKVAAMLRKGKGEHYVLQLTKTTYQRNAYRVYVAPEQVNGRVVMVQTKEYGLDPKPVPDAQFLVVEGRDVAVKTVVEHMAPTLAKPPSRRKAVMTEPPPEFTWQLLGRFSDAQQARQTASQAEVLFNLQPFWKTRPQAAD